jgi:hypothetical protein
VRPAALGLLIAVLAACSRGPLIATAVADAGVDAPVDAANEAPIAIADASPPAPFVEDPKDLALAAARITSLTLRAGIDGRRGLFDATLAGAPVAARLQLALDKAPVAHRVEVAFARVARALGAASVPPVAARSLSTAQLGALASTPDALALTRTHAAILADGTIDALLVAPPASRVVALVAAPERLLWARWSTALEAPADETPGALRGYVEMLALDFLTANVTRRTVAVDASGALILDANEGAFALRPDPSALRAATVKLRAVRRFPRGLRARLLAFDAAAQARSLLGPRFEDWLVSPRAVADLDQRRQQLIAVIDERIAADGQGAVERL